MRMPKYDKQHCRDLAAYGYEFVCYEPDDNSYIFQKGNYQTGFLVIRLLESDMPEKNAHFMMEHDLTNTNKGA